MIEIVSPVRTLRLKGETTAEHRLWSDSIYRLCNPPPAQSSVSASTPAASSAPAKAPVSQPPPASEAKREEWRREEREAAVPVAEAKAAADRKPPARSDECTSSSRSLSAKETVRQDDSWRRRQEEEEEEAQLSSEEEEDRNDRSESNHDDRTSGRRPVDSPPRSACRAKAESPRPRCDSDADSRSRGRRRSGSRESSRDASDRDGESDDDRQAKSSRRRASSMDSDECDDDDNNRDVRPPQLSKRPSLLVASIKAASPCIPTAETVAAPQSPKFSEDEDEAGSPKRFGAPRSIPKPKEEPIDESDDPQEESPRTNDQDDGSAHRPPSPAVERNADVAEKSDAAPTKRNNGEYFDSEEEDEEDDSRRQAVRPIHKEPPASVVTAPRSEVARDNNFVDDDWDAEEDVGPTKASATKQVRRAACESCCLCGCVFLLRLTLVGDVIACRWPRLRRRLAWGTSLPTPTLPRRTETEWLFDPNRCASVALAMTQNIRTSKSLRVTVSRCICSVARGVQGGLPWAEARFGCKNSENLTLWRLK